LIWNPSKYAAPLKPNKETGFRFPEITVSRRPMSAANALDAKKLMQHIKPQVWLQSFP
jgi:hypothetical protein